MISLENLYQAYEEYRIKHPFKGKCKGLDDPMNYIMELGGKRIRPLLVLAAGDGFNIQAPTLLPLAHAVEVFHNFSLVHDDIMDKAPLRRGKSTVHIRWDESTAILAGDNLLIEAIDCILQSQHPKQNELLALFIKTSREVCEGQMMDMEFPKLEKVNIEAYLEMIKLKTAVLLGCSLSMGAIASGANEHIQALMYALGISMGLEFQLMDDYLDTFGEKAEIGKKIGGDIAENKNTWLKITSEEWYPEETKEYFSIENETVKIETITTFWRKKGLDVQLLNIKNEYGNKSHQILAKLDQEGVKTASLRAIQALLENRTK